jgi:CRISPR type IV-associated protein Csf1
VTGNGRRGTKKHKGQNMSELMCSVKKIQVLTNKEHGYCVLCGNYSDCGHPLEFGEKFTAYSWLQGGSVFCPYCYEIYKNQLYRRHSWYLDAREFKILNRDDILTLLNLTNKEIPFAIYINTTRKKQGYLQLINRLNYNNEMFVVAFDDDLVWIDRQKLEEAIEFAKTLKRKKLTKGEMLSGRLNPKRYEQLSLDDLKKIREYDIGLWRVVVYGI